MAQDKASEAILAEIESRDTPERFATPFTGEAYDESGSLVVGLSMFVLEPEDRVRSQAYQQAYAIFYQHEDDSLMIEVGLYAKPEGEAPAVAAERMIQARKWALAFAEGGDPSSAIVVGAMPKPTVWPEPRKVTVDGKLVAEKIEAQF